MIVFDVSNQESFQNAVNNWLSALLNATKDNEIKPVVLLCGNKTGADVEALRCCIFCALLTTFAAPQI
jgi:GTPase SAR1 family protein